MARLVPDGRHPALDVPEAERKDYLSVVASMAYADHDADESELVRIRELCEQLEVSAESTEAVLGAARDPDHVAIRDILSRLKSSALRFALIVDAVDVAYADNRIDPAETAEIESLAAQLDITHAQVALIHRYVSRRGRGGGLEDKDLAAGLTAAGIPLAALAIAKVIGAPIIAGVGLAAAIGVGSYMSVRWLYGKANRQDRGAESNGSES